MFSRRILCQILLKSRFLHFPEKHKKYRDHKQQISPQARHLYPLSNFVITDALRSSFPQARHLHLSFPAILPSQHFRLPILYFRTLGSVFPNGFFPHTVPSYHTPFPYPALCARHLPKCHTAAAHTHDEKQAQRFHNQFPFSCKAQPQNAP